MRLAIVTPMRQMQERSPCACAVCLGQVLMQDLLHKQPTGIDVDVVMLVYNLLSQLEVALNRHNIHQAEVRVLAARDVARET